jgi:DNA repair photolyase
VEQIVKLVGIARQAAEGKLLWEKRRVDYRSLPTRNWLNRCESDRVPFHWTINPYRGCEYNCRYCYARYTHEFLGHPGATNFESDIYAKEWDSRTFRRELARVKPGEVIGIGTATDPYQPAERIFGQTRQVLDALRTVKDLSIWITTKSDLVSRDVDVLKTLSEHNNVCVTFSVSTMNRKLARLTEPQAPRPDLRLRAVRELASGGVRVGVIASPILPLLTDSEENLEEVAKAAKDAGASQFSGNVLFLMPTAQQVFFDFLREHFPQHLKRYQASYAAGAYLEGKYPERIRALVDDIRRRVGISGRDVSASPMRLDLVRQLSLFC